MRKALFVAACLLITISAADMYAGTTVSIVASDAQAAEGAASVDTGLFTISRTGSTASTLTVNFTVTGTATDGNDYTTIGTSVMIAAGSSTATLTITQIDDATAEGSETVIVTIAADAAYTVAASPNDTATVTITDDDGGGPPPASGFRFLTTSIPGSTGDPRDASTNLVYDAMLLTANAAGTVTYSITSGRLPTGMTLDSATGFITGRPTVVETVAVTFSANDGTNTITFSTSIKVSAKGGGGNAGAGFPVGLTLPDGKVGVAYGPTDVSIEFGVGPFFFGAIDLPPGITISGLADHDRTFTLSGTPSAAGTYFVTFSATDQGEGNNKVVTIIPIKVLPATSDFQFTTLVMDNGEVGTAYSHTITTNSQTPITIGASGLPLGLSMDPVTGVISGTPTTAGTYQIVISANNGTDTISMNRTLIIAPSSTSSFHWLFSGGLPTGTLFVAYDRTNPPLVLGTQNPSAGSGAIYSASGLPEGITYNTTTGELSGIPTEPGIYPVVFTATDSATGAVITFAYDMVVLPQDSADVNSLPVNLWVKKGQIKTGDDGKESFAMQYIYNANRTAAKIFDPSPTKVPVDSVIVRLGGIAEVNVTPPTTAFTGTKPKFSFKSAKGVLPARSVTLDMSSQVLSVTSKNDTIPDSVPSIITNRVTIGRKGYKLDLFFDAKGKFTSTSGYRKTAFVVASAKVSVKGGGKDSAAFGMLLADPSFIFPSATANKNVKFRVINSAGADVVAKDFTSIVTFTTSVDKKTGLTTYKMKSGKDATNPVGKFQYDSKSGKLTVALKNATLAGLTGTEEHVSVEMTIADKQYFTGVTIFAPKAGSYSTKLPK